MKLLRDPETGLTPNEEKFCRLLATGKNQTEALREAFPRSLKWKDKTQHAQASTLAARENIRRRIVQILSEYRANAKYEVAHAMAQLAEAMDMARRKNDAKALTGAIALACRINGHMVEDRKNERPPLSEAADDLLEAAIVSAQRELEGDRPTIQ